MSRFKKYLIISTQTSSLYHEAFRLDHVAWKDFSKIKNINDYDEIAINLDVAPANIRGTDLNQLQMQISSIFDPASWTHIMLSGGRIILIGKPNTKIKLESHSYNATYMPLRTLLDVTEDLRPLDYRRVERNFEGDNKILYKYLDSVSIWDYSLGKFGIGGHWAQLLNNFNVRYTTIGITSYGTALAVSYKFHNGINGQSGSIICLPPLGRGSDDEDLFITKEYWGIATTLPEPAWVDKLRLPNQFEISNELKSKREKLSNLQREILHDENQLQACKRWYRLLYDDGSSLESIIKESLEILGATVVKTSREKDDYRLKIPGFVDGVMEIKGTHNPMFGKGALRQLAGWMDEVIANENIPVKGVFIGNSARNDVPMSRGKLFEKNIEDYAIIRDIVILRSMDLFCLTILKQCDLLDDNSFWKDFFASKGALDMTKYWEMLPPEFQFPQKKSSEN